MNLNETQIDNLVSFYFNINEDMDAPLMSQDPSYIMEKWGKWISRNNFIENYNPNIIPINDLTKSWIRRWCNISDDMFLNNNESVLGKFMDDPNNHIIISIVKFISSYETAPTFLNLFHIIALFEHCFPNVEINKTKGGVLHPIIDQHIDQYMNYEGNIEYKKVYLRESYVNLLTN